MQFIFFNYTKAFLIRVEIVYKQIESELEMREREKRRDGNGCCDADGRR